jgi:hypothetical protein
MDSFNITMCLSNALAILNIASKVKNYFYISINKSQGPAFLFFKVDRPPLPKPTPAPPPALWRSQPRAGMGEGPPSLPLTSALLLIFLSHQTTTGPYAPPPLQLVELTPPSASSRAFAQYICHPFPSR